MFTLRVGEQDVRLALQRVPVHGPQAAAQALMVPGRSIIRIMHVVVVDGSETHEHHRPAGKRARPVSTAENLVGTE
jgi:hypothetical protein